MEEKPRKPYEYSYENEATRDDVREDINWYFQQGMTGAEAYRVCRLILKRWYKKNPNGRMYPGFRNYTYIQHLHDSIGNPLDPWPPFEFAMAIEEMMDERDAIDSKTKDPICCLPVPENLKFVEWMTCNCCERCAWGSERKNTKPYLIPEHK